MKRNNAILLGIISALAIGGGITASFATSTPLFMAQQIKPIQTTNTFGILGHVTLTVTDADGNVKNYIQTDNLIVNVGENCIAENLFDASSGSGSTACTGSGGSTGGHGNAAGGFKFIGIGTGTTAEGADQTALVTQVARSTATSGPTITAASGAAKSSVTLSRAFTGVTGTITESGLFDAASGGNMFARKTFTGIPLTSSDTLTVSWTIDIGSTS